MPLPLSSSTAPRLATRRQRLALGFLAGAALFAGSFAMAPAHAQSYSRPFVAAYQPVARLVTGEAPDLAAARAQLGTLEAAIQNDDDRNAAGSLILQIGTGLNEPALQRRGLEMMLASGKVAPAQVGQFHFFVGNLAFNANDFAAARSALESALANGYADDDVHALIMESYLAEDRTAEGIAYLQQRMAAGQVPENWILRGLQSAYNAGLVEQANALSRDLVLAYPSQRNWMNALQVVAVMNQFDPQAQLDLLRLMRLTGALSQRAEYVQMIEAADPRVMSNEVLPILEEGRAAGHFSASDDYYLEVKALAEARSAEDRRDADAAAADARTGDARLALNVGNLMWSLQDFARAEELYQMALERGGERDLLLTRIGMAQVRQGHHAEAIETLSQVAGDRAPIAVLWAAYARVQGA